MMERSKSTLFLIEQLIVIAVFALCATACISILANAYFMAKDSRDISNALFAAESVADSFKAVSGDFENAARISGGTARNIDGANEIIVFFDNNWQVSDKGTAFYVLRLVSDIHGSFPYGLIMTDLSVERIDGNDELVNFPVAVRTGGAR